LQTLKYTPKRAAKHIEKVLRSAIANAERKAEDSGAPLDVDMLFVAQCFVNEGRAGSGCALRRWAGRFATRSAPRTYGGRCRASRAAAERVAANVAEAEAQKGVRGTRAVFARR